MKQFSRTVLKNSAFGLAAQFAIKILSFIFTILIVRELGAGDYGQYAAAMAFGGLFMFIGDLGLSPYTVREVARMRDTPDAEQRIGAFFANVLLLRIVLSVLATILMTCAAWLTNRPPVMIGAIALIGLTQIVYAVHGTLDALLSGHERFGVSSSARVVNQVIFIAIGALVLWFGVGYYGLIAATGIGVVVMTWLCWRAVRALGVHPQQANPQIWWGLLRASLPFGVIAFTLGLSYRFDSVLLNIYQGDVATGHYNAAYNLVFSAAMFSNVVNTALFPSLTRQHMTDPASLPQIYERMLRYLMLLAFPIAIGASLLADQIVPFLFDEGYAESATVLRIIIWVVPLMYLSEFLGYIVVVNGGERRVARSIVISTALNIVCNLILIPIYGLIGAAIMTVVTEAVLVGQYLWALRDELARVNRIRAFLRPLIAAVLMGGVVLVLMPYIHLLVNALIGALVYAVLLVVLQVVGRDELQFLKGIRRPIQVEATR